MAIDATPGGASADSFVTDTDATAYMATRLHVAEWTAAVTADKEASLKWASRLLDVQDWAGTVAAAAQALRWPRSGVEDLEGGIFGSDIVPQWLKDATAELALELIKSNRTADSDTRGFSKIKVDVIELEIDKYDRASAIPDAVYDLIRPYLASQGVTLVRT